MDKGTNISDDMNKTRKLTQGSGLKRDGKGVGGRGKERERKEGRREYQESRGL